MLQVIRLLWSSSFVLLSAIANTGYSQPANYGTVVWGQQKLDVRDFDQSLIQIAAGGSHNAAIRADRTVITWGSNGYGESTVPSGLSEVSAVAAGLQHTAALKTDGTVIAWGDNTLGQTNVPEDLSEVSAIAAGAMHTLALKTDGTVVAWGYNVFEQTNVPGDLGGVIAIAAGVFHSVALKADGSIVAWGSNRDDQIMVPAGLNRVIAISAGSSHTVALRDDGTVVAWGNADFGQTSVPAGLSSVSAIAAGDSHTVALKTDGTVVAWGQTFYGQTSVPTGLSDISSIAAGGVHTVALKTDGTIVSWGRDDQGQATDPSRLSGFRSISPGPWHILALKSDGTVAAWGDNSEGKTNTPSGLIEVRAVAAGMRHSVALKTDGTAVAWGNNFYGQTTIPPDLGDISSIAAGETHTVALKTDGTLMAFGLTTVPEGLSSVSAIACGNNHTLALMTDGSVVAWGENDHGQTSVPDGLSRVIAISAGAAHSVALKFDGTVVAWGDNGYGQVTVPDRLNGVKAIAAGGSHTLALKFDGTVVGWGDNRFGQATMPTSLRGISAIAAGELFSIALVQVTEIPDLPPITDIATTGVWLDATHNLASQGSISRPVPGIINAEGHTVFKAVGKVGAGSITKSNDSLLITNIAGSLKVVGQEGMSAQGGGTIPGTFSHLSLTESGRCMTAERFGSTSKSKDYGYLVSENAATLEIVSREGDSAPGGGIFTGHTGRCATDDHERIYIPGSLSAVSATKNSGIWYDEDSELFVLAKEGQNVSGLTQDFSWLGNFSGALSAAGDGVAFIAALQDNPDTASEKTPVALNAGLFSGAPGKLELVARKGDLIPSVGKLNAFSAVSRNSYGDHAFISLLALSKKAPVASSSNDQVLMVKIEDVTHLVARESITNLTGTLKPVRFGSFYMTNAGEVIYQAWLAGKGVTSANDSVICRWTALGGNEVLAREGIAAPDTGLKYKTLQSMSVSSGGAVVIQSTLSQGTALMRAVPGGQLSLVVRTGITTLFNDAPRNVLSVGIYQLGIGKGGGGRGFGTAINDDGAMFTVLYIGNGQYLARIYRPSMW